MRPATVRAHDDGTDAWRVTSAPPAASLAGHVTRYADYTERTGSFTVRRELAGTGGVLLLNLGPPIAIVAADGATLTVGSGEGFVGGVSEDTSLSRSAGAQSGVHVFAPLEVLARIVGCPPAALANRVVPVDALVGTARELGARLGEANSAERRFDLLDRFIAARLAEAPAPDSQVEAAAALIRRAPAAIARIADAVNLDRRTLARRFGAT